jgi:CRP-like cAMP-binding protein
MNKGIEKYFTGQQASLSELKQFMKDGEVKRFNKGDFILNEGEIEQYIYYLKSGTVKVGILKDSEEWLLDFWFDDDFFSSYTSFLTREPSRVFIQTLSVVELFRFHYNTLQEAYKNSNTANLVGRLMAEQLFIRKTQREIDFLTKSAEERYSDLVKFNPEVIQRIPVNQIARFLGIHPESLSRIRKNLNS